MSNGPQESNWPKEVFQLLIDALNHPGSAVVVTGCIIFLMWAHYRFSTGTKKRLALIEQVLRDLGK